MSETVNTLVTICTNRATKLHGKVPLNCINCANILGQSFFAVAYKSTTHTFHMDEDLIASEVEVIF
jgi:hypothetical protein